MFSLEVKILNVVLSLPEVQIALPLLTEAELLKWSYKWFVFGLFCNFCYSTVLCIADQNLNLHQDTVFCFGLS